MTRLNAAGLTVGAAVVLAAAVVIAQPSQDQANQFVERMMEGDANGDGKLEKSEVSPRFADGPFESADSNADGYVTRDELSALLMERTGGRVPGQPAPPPAADDDGAFHEAMEAAGGTIRGLRRSPMDATSLEADLAGVDRLQAALIDAKASLRSVEMASQAHDKYADDMAAYHKDFRLMFVDAISATLDLERALLEGDTDAAKAAFGAVREIQGAGHDAFKDDDH